MKTLSNRNVILRIGVLAVQAGLFALSACSMPTATETVPPLSNSEISIAPAQYVEPIAVEPLQAAQLPSTEPALENVVEAAAMVEVGALSVEASSIEEMAIEEVAVVQEETVVQEAVTIEEVAVIEEAIVEEAIIVEAPVVAVEQPVEVMIATPKTLSLNPDAAAGGYYKGFMTDSAGNGRDVTIALLPNGNVRWRVDYHFGMESQILVGSWETGAETVTVRLSGAENSTESIIEKYVFDKVGFSLVSAESNTKLYRFQALAFNAMAPDYDVIAATDMMRAASFAGTYKAMVPAMDAPGRDVTIVLKSDGSFDWTAYRLNSDKAEIKVGTWMVAENDTMQLTITGTPDRAYSTAKEMSFALTNGVLHNANKDMTLYALPELVAPHHTVASAIDG